MQFSAPAFWQERFHPLALLLWPIGKAYQWITEMRLRRNAAKVPVPVICIGNITVGGTGKTPIVQYLVQQLQQMGMTPHIILRGYGGHAREITRVDLSTHDAHDVGDEALMHAGVAPTWVGGDRHQSALAAIAAGADVIVMDDGMQNPSLSPTVKWMVLDAARGIGNGYGIPAGPLRESLGHALKRIDAVILVGEGNYAPQTEKPILRVKIETDSKVREMLAGKIIYAFAGIGYPQKLAVSLRGAGLELAGVRGFPDHHVYREEEIAALHKRAKLLGAQLVTTQKDFVRLPEAWREDIIPVDVTLHWENPGQFQQIIRDASHEKA